MLYVTTRNKRDAYTAQRVLKEGRGPDGGMYLPFHAPRLDPEDYSPDNSFAQITADILSRMFRASLSAWDVEFAVGRDPIRLRQLRHRIVVAEVWHNPRQDYGSLERNLLRILGGSPKGWSRTAIRIAVLAGVFSQLRREGIETAELALTAGDFGTPMAAWYARAWGLPIQNIVCACNENQELWNLMSHGQMRTDTVCVSTSVPQADVAVPSELERLIYECAGAQEVERFLDACRQGRSYSPNEVVLSRLRQGIRVSVVSSQRLYTTIPSVYHTHNLLLSPEGALAYGGLLDFRAKTGQTGWAVVLEDRSPILDGAVVSQALDMPQSALRGCMER